MLDHDRLDHDREQAEFSKFYVENVSKLVRFLVAEGLSLSDAADCVQETLIDALPPVWSTLENPYAWCRTVAHRKRCRLLRSRREAPLAEVDERCSPLIAPDSGLENLEQHDDLLRRLAQLKGHNQRIVMAWTYDGATPAEIAVELGMTPETVRSTLRAARNALRRLRDEEGGPA